MINFAPAPNNALLSLLNSNNPTTTAVAAQPLTPSTPQQTFGFTTGNAAASLLPSFSGAPANGTGSSIFAGLMNPAGTNSRFTQQGQTPLTGMNTMPAATAPSGSDALGLAGLDQLLAGANQYASTMQTSPTGVNTAGIPPANAPRSASFAPLAPQGQGSPMIVLTGDALAKLQEGQNPTEARDADPETQEALNAKIKELEAKITKAKGTPSSDSELRIVALERQLAEARINQNDSALQARLDDAEKQIRALKAKATATTPKRTSRLVVAQAAKPTSKTT